MAAMQSLGSGINKEVWIRSLRHQEVALNDLLEAVAGGKFHAKAQ